MGYVLNRRPPKEDSLQMFNLGRSAKYLGINPHAMRDLFRSGRIPCRLIGKQTYRTTKEALDEYKRGTDFPIRSDSVKVMKTEGSEAEQ